MKKKRQNLKTDSISTTWAILREPDKESLEYEELKDSIHNQGLLVPILVRIVDEEYSLIDGLHRLTIFKDLDLDEIPAEIIEESISDIQALCRL